ncbi:NAD-dependent epimerase/dehydratase family protein, partial [Flavobacterium sp.]|uniref:NAD-dependent epimerase/dehydratase family protein n=1 Tax=Flavobacterium sp. TaxID=239 RepID=UPI003C62F1D7
NIEGTANIVNFCIAKNVTKLCHLSSIAALGDLAEHETILTEETEWNPEKPHSDYAISKYGAEMELWRGQQEGLNSIILNPGVIVGPGFYEQGSGLLFKKVSEGLKYYTEGITGFIAVTDVVRIAIELMQSEITNERYTLIADNYSFRDIINTMSDALHQKRPEIHLKPWQIEIAWRLDWIRATLFRTNKKLTQYTAKASYAQTTLSNQKIKAELKFRFLDIHHYIMDIGKLNN